MADELEDFEFAVAQAGHRVRLVERPAVVHDLFETRPERVADVDLARQHGAHRLHDVLGGFLLHDVAASAGAERAHREVTLVVHREHDRGKPRHVHAEPLDEAETVLTGKTDVDDGQVGTGGLHGFERRLHVPRLAADAHVRFLLEEAADPLPDDRVIIHDQDGDLPLSIDPVVAHETRPFRPLVARRPTLNLNAFRPRRYRAAAATSSRGSRARGYRGFR